MFILESPGREIDKMNSHMVFPGKAVTNSLLEIIISIRRLMLAGWLVYYLSWSTWSEEAFANFIYSLGKKFLWQALFIIFIGIILIEVILKFYKKFKVNPIFVISWSILPLGILLFLGGVFISVNTRMDTRILTGKDDAFGLPWEDTKYAVIDLIPGIKERFLDLEQESPSPIFTREPVLFISDFKNTYRIGVYPPTRINGTFFHILNFNVAPSLEIKDQKGNTLLKGDLALQILPAGNTDYAVLRGLPYRITMKLLPSGEIKRGNIIAKEYDLNKRLYEIKIFRIRSPEEAGELIAEVISQTPIKFDGYSLSVIGHTYWAFLEVVKDDAVYIIGAGLLFIAAGLLIRLFMLPVWLRQIKKP